MSPSPCSVFISYASEDRAFADVLSRGLSEAGIEVWFDRNELKGGDAWDGQIRQRIKDCTFFVALISAATQARAEGYFRREWKLAVDRTHDMADDRPFLVPVLITDMRENEARVPERFREIHWLRVLVATDRGQLVEQIRRLQETVDRGSTMGWTPTAVRPRPDTRPPVPPRRNVRPFLWGAMVVAVAMGGAIWWVLAGANRGSEPALAARAAAVEPNSVAVLPFADVSNTPGNEYFADGLTDELIATLGKDPALHIAARTSSFAFKGRTLAVQQIAAQLQVGMLIEGTVLRTADDLRVRVQLVNGVTGHRLWSEEYPRKLTDIFAVQAEIAAAIAAKLRPTAARPVPQRIATTNLDAYDAFLRGRSFEVKTAARESIEQSVAFFKQATGLDPNYGVAWAHLGNAYVRLHSLGYDDSDEILLQARNVINRALQIDPDEPGAHRALANLYSVHWTNQTLAEKELLIAEKGLPNDADLIADLAANQLNRGLRRKAVDYVRRAMKLDPQNVDIANLGALILDVDSQYAEAVAERERAFQIGGWPVSITEKAKTIRNWKGDLGLALKTIDLLKIGEGADEYSRGLYWRTKAAFLAAHGDFDGALAAVDRLTTEVVPNQFFYYTKSLMRAQIKDAMGDEAAATPFYREALGPAERYRADNPRLLRAHTSLALIYAGLGRREEAFACAERGLQIVPASENPYVAARSGLRVMAQVNARFGNIEQALAIVREQTKAGFWKRHELLLDIEWRLLRKDARFQKLAQEAPL